ncbi:hypothetical protein HanPSC8_Chr16g0698671 [Helianthus annuus]|nr:hypothetical protein HanLR1_Chr16g0605631 [Helianthus annuus]KAJ0819664.1 hypothetical protein HanPSC8_Chr16g0698671 [Helianthus annuus]
MGKSKEVAGKSKGKGVASSSSNAKPRGTKQGKLILRDEPDEPMPQAQVPPQQGREEPPPKPDWKGGLLTNIHGYWQAECFDEKMDKIGVRKDGFICEKEVDIDHFRPFSIVQKFEELGWEAALKCYNGEKTKVYLDAIQEWVGNLTLGSENHPRNMTLTGSVGGVNVVMSAETLGEIANFDSKKQYTYPSENLLYDHPEKNPKWEAMVKELFLEGKVAGMKRENLKHTARLLLSIVQQNVLPGRSDRSNLRKPDIDHYSAKEAWSFNETSTFIKLAKGHTTFTLDGFNNQNGLEYVRTERYHKLKACRRKWGALRTDARILLPGEEDESESDDSVMGDSDGEGEDAEDVATGFDVGTSSGVPDVEDVSEFVELERHEDWSSWPDFAQVLYDKLTRLGEQQKRDLDRNELWHRVHAYNEQKEINDRYLDDKKQRLNDDASVGGPPLHHSVFASYHPNTKYLSLISFCSLYA